MRHVRDATRSYAPGTTIHMTSDNSATLASRLNRMATPTFFSPSATQYIDYGDHIELSRSSPESQSNGFLKSPSRCLLAGLGIHYRLDSGNTMEIGERHYLYDDGQTASYMQADNFSSSSNHSTPPGSAFQLIDHTAESLGRLSESQSSLAVFSDTSLPDLGYSSLSSSVSLASTRSASDNEEGQASRAFSLAYNLADDVLSCSPSNIGLIPDVNMYNLALFTKPPSVGVDPSVIMGQLSASPQAFLSPHLTPRSATFCGFSPLFIHDPGSSTLGAMGELTPGQLSQDCPSSHIIHDIVTILSTSATHEPDKPESLTAIYSEQPSFEQCAPQKRAMGSPIVKMETLPDAPILRVFSPKQEQFYILSSCDNFSFPSSEKAFPPSQSKGEPDLTTHNDPHPSPIFNAHMGIELSELAFRAQRYRVRHHTQEIDRGWLMHFAGKLSDRGELIEEFRCYVVGCSQRNKRRDHIIVHVGAHVDQRPFGCSMCPQRFLRKNECKRHEASHTGVRPYHCEVCGQTFVRQDLLKRHTKRTHGLEKGSRGAGSRRKKARTE
ncbi:hypothetical protein DEU56DRAFT_879748 [Suillus clintonianus]|uniref:uncharacterized protein n=1 Tax=Suillus clintonianus TaxID=1904413 RepID=UPI001B877F89|nr:uncharacterized protein DEU56DRAFT_879748 [Suillus clintonianus]KAG2152927.1 hypothetical protein DEU56DRAFT_879748 [Suillus clintonianus]